MNLKIMTLNEFNSSPSRWIDVTTHKDIVSTLPPGKRRYLEIQNSTIGVTLLHRETFEVMRFPEEFSQPLVISRGSKKLGKLPRNMVAYLVPIEFSGEEFERFKLEQSRLMEGG